MQMAGDELVWLQSWVGSQVDGDWEHSYGVEIKTLDNPGWMVVIDLTGTDLGAAGFEGIKYERGDADWLSCEVKGGRFVGVGDIRKLTIILAAFRQWVSKAR